MPDLPADLTIDTATPEQRRAAIWLVLAALGAERSPEHVSSLVGAMSAGQLSAAGLLVARRDERVVGAAWGSVQPGGVASYWPPAVVGSEPPELVAELHRRLQSWLNARGATLLQAIVAPDAAGFASRLQSLGFSHGARLRHLAWDSSQAPPVGRRATAHPPSPTITRLTAEQLAALPALVEATYEGTLDCPCLDGVRQAEQVLEGYRAVGVHAPELWLGVGEADALVGCVLLADWPAADQLELVYMGLVASARGRGWGHGLTTAAQQATVARGRRRLVAAVDCANQPALACYLRAGFTPFAERDVWLKRLAQLSAQS